MTKGKLVWSDGRVETREDIQGQYFIKRYLTPRVNVADIDDFRKIYIYNGMPINRYHPNHPKYDPDSYRDIQFKCSHVDSQGFVVYIQCS